ncbi:hypothetical protein BDZ89DRAFT_1042158 [Hymenopellis radicata]|nr:hypothetical protein BDZ89DRAFT_1042158 [Hymenopellis radicata]
MLDLCSLPVHYLDCSLTSTPWSSLDCDPIDSLVLSLLSTVCDDAPVHNRSAVVRFPVVTASIRGLKCYEFDGSTLSVCAGANTTASAAQDGACASQIWDGGGHFASIRTDLARRIDHIEKTRPTEDISSPDTPPTKRRRDVPPADPGVASGWNGTRDIYWLPPAGEHANSFIAAGPTSRTHHIGKVIDEISLQAITLQPRSHLPTPTTEPVSIAIYTATDTPQRSPSRRTAADSDPPRVVVVNPTPNLTPHPTPPATPVLPPATAGRLPNHSSVSPLPPPRSYQRSTVVRQTLPMPATASLRPSDVKFFAGSPSSSSTSSGSSTSSSNSTDNSPEETQPSSSTTTADIPPADIPPSLCRTETLPAALYDADKVLQSIARNGRYRVQKVATHARMPSVKDRESLEAEDRALAEQQRLEHDLEIKHRREQEERQKLITWEREMELERQRRKEREQEDKRREEHEKELQKLREVERLKELERVKLQEGLLRRTASTGRLPTQDTVIFDFTEEAQNDTLQPSRSSHPNSLALLLVSTASTSSAAATKTRTRDLLPSAPNLQALASQKAAMRMQSTLKGAFTPVHRGGSPTKSESSKASSSRNSKQPSPKAHPNGAPPSKPPAPPSLKGKEKEKQKQHLTRTGRPFELLSSDEEEEDGDDDDDWTSADEASRTKWYFHLRLDQKLGHILPTATPPPINHRTTRNRRQMPADMQKHLRMDELHHAFEEAERQTETFTFNKLPKRSYSNLSRTNSGLLSQLMHPDRRLYPTCIDGAIRVHVGSVRNGGAIKPGDYRPKARPNEEEMEDETDGEDNSLNVSNSVAQEKLKAIFGNMRGGGANANANKGTAHRACGASCCACGRCAGAHDDGACRCADIPVQSPGRCDPVSPRTTRQWMLRTEMSESVRTNLLWQRKMDKQLMPPPRRNKSSTAISTIPSVVKLTEKTAPVDGGMRVEQEREEARDEIRRVNLMRNKSWAADYHPQ